MDAAERDANGREIEGCDRAAESPVLEDRDSVSVTLEEPLLRANTARISTTSQLAIVGSNVCPIESLDYEYVYCVLLAFLNVPIEVLFAPCFSLRLGSCGR